MQLAGVDWGSGSLSPLAKASPMRWLPYGPAAGRAATSMLIGSRTGNALTFLANQPNAEYHTLTAVADRLLSAEADMLLSQAHRYHEPAHQAAWSPKVAGELPIQHNPWVSPFFGRDLADVSSTADLIALTKEWTLHGKDDWLPIASAQGADTLTANLFAQHDFNHQPARYTTLAMTANEAMPLPEVPKIVPKKADFLAAAEFLGAGALGVLVGAAASAFGAPAPLAIALGGTAASVGVWYAASRLPTGDLSLLWNLFTGTVGKVVDHVLDWVTPGRSVSDVPDTDAAKNVGSLITNTNPPISDALADMLFEAA